MPGRIQLVAILGSVLLLAVVLEMVRRRRLMERYALLWLLSGLVLLALASWSGALVRISRAVGVIYPPNALFFIAFVFVLVLLLHFSAAVSRLSDQTKVLAQQLALLDERLRQHEGEAAMGRPDFAEEQPDLIQVPSVAGRGPGERASLSETIGEPPG